MDAKYEYRHNGDITYEIPSHSLTLYAHGEGIEVGMGGYEFCKDDTSNFIMCIEDYFLVIDFRRYISGTCYATSWSYELHVNSSISW